MADKKELNNIIQKFLNAYEENYSKYILEEDTAKAYLFKHLIEELNKLDKDKYFVLTEFRINENKKFDIVIITKKEYDKYGSNNYKGEPNLISAIEIKYNYGLNNKKKLSKDIEIRFIEDKDKLLKYTSKIDFKYFISLDSKDINNFLQKDFKKEGIIYEIANGDY